MPGIVFVVVDHLLAHCQSQSASGLSCYPLEADAEVGEEQDISSDSLQNRMGRFRWVQRVNGGSHNENTTGADMRQESDPISTQRVWPRP